MARKINQKVKTGEIIFDKELYPRVNFDWQTAYDYAQSMNTGAKFPPITIAILNKKMYLVDGKHRLEALKQCKIKEVNAEIFIGWNRKRIFEEAIKRNIAHGKSLSPFEKRRIALKFRAMNYSSDKISQLIQVPFDKLDNFVGQRLINAITGEEIVKPELKHLAGTDYEGDINITQKLMKGSNQITLLTEVIRLIEKKLLDLKDEKVRNLVIKLKLLLKGNKI